MRRVYVDISGVPSQTLEFFGYVTLAEDDDFLLLSHKGDVHLIDKAKPYLFVDDINDAMLLDGPFRLLSRIQAPPKK